MIYGVSLPVRHNFTDKRVDIHRLVDCPHTTPAAVNCFRAPVICFDRDWLRSEWHWLYRHEYMFFRPTSRTCALAHHGYTTSMVNGLITLMTPSTRPHPWTTDCLSITAMEWKLTWSDRYANHGPTGPESHMLPLRHDFINKRVANHAIVDGVFVCGVCIYVCVYSAKP